jgi:hypothetical protein
MEFPVFPRREAHFNLPDDTVFYNVPIPRVVSIDQGNQVINGTD